MLRCWRLCQLRSRCRGFFHTDLAADFFYLDQEFVPVGWWPERFFVHDSESTHLYSTIIQNRKMPCGPERQGHEKILQKCSITCDEYACGFSLQHADALAFAH